jgi:HlyD family secretion protein
MTDALVLSAPVHSEAGNPQREIRLGIAIAVAFFVVFLGWAAFMPLDAGVHASPADREIANQVMQLQMSEMHARSGSISAQQSVLGQRAGQLVQQQSGYTQQRNALIEQERLIEEELTGLRKIAEKGFASMNRVRELERAEAQLKGQQAAMESEFARAGEGIGETKMQSLSVSRERLEQIESDLKDTQSKLSETLPKLVATREQLQHSQVRAPATGQVVGLQVFTVGGVVAPGQKLMDIVPDGRELIIQAQLKPTDADDVFAGQKAQVRFLSVHNRSLPLFTGTVRTVSADSFTDEKTGRSYFRTEIVVPEAELNRIRAILGQGQLRPGLPVEAVLTVRKRTALQYLLEPLTGAIWRSGHED